MIDERGLLVQADGDGGDTPHRMGLKLCELANKKDHHFFALFTLAALKQLKTDHGWIRHPVKWNDPKDFSRDQASRLHLGFAMGDNQVSDIAREYYQEVIQRSFTHPNGDIVGFGELGFTLRLFKLWWLYPLLLILDVRFVIDIYLRSKWDGCSLFIPDMLYAKKVYPTPWIYIAASLIKRQTELRTEMLTNHSLEKNGCVELIESANYFFDEIEKWSF